MPASALAWTSVLLWAAAAGLFSWCAAAAACRATYVTLADGRRRERRLPFSFRLLLPLAPNVARPFRSPALAGARERVASQLAAAGVDGLLAPWEFLSLKLLLPLCLGPFCLLALHLALRAAGPDGARLLPPLGVLALVLLWCRPALWLRAAVRRRKADIVKALPFALDLLTLSVEAGLDFMSALRRCAERPGAADPLSEELLRVVRETQVGTPRRDALRAFAARAGVPDVRSLVGALVQADELGVSVGAILRVQAAQIRQRRFERAEKLANEAPVKLLGPLVLFVFPAVFLVLLGPVLFRLSGQF
ncbi:MAG: type II secretion system F family protein [Kiritimatiellae bacterium]|nr:type II secretion system F family protein [Kiritimatiellia bacterium]